LLGKRGGNNTELATNNVTSDEFVDCVGNDAPIENGNEGPGVRKSSRIRHASGPWWANCALISTTSDPATIHQAIKRPDSAMWKDSMPCEYDSLIKHNTWTLVPRPLNVNVIACKWVFKTKSVKNDADLDIKKYKSRLVAKEYSQIHGVDYEETFAPVVKFTSIRLLLALVSHFNLERHQMDVVTAFLNGDLDEIIHMEQPQGFVAPESADKVCRLRKALYGLKQANRQ
jgi:Reverse transcriptase (RNA-dependent DNA polymerase)